jgi:erythronate-4-phosphate dehydrogenase
MKIVADDKIPFFRHVLEPFASVVYLPSSAITRETVKDADILVIRTRTTCNEALLRDTRVGLIATATTGDDHIDKDYCAAHGVQWVNAEGCNSTAVSEYVAAAMLCAAKEKKYSLGQMTLGIIGAGRIGTRVNRIAKALGMKVLLNDPPRARTEGSAAFIGLDTLVSQSDIITLHVPYTAEGPDRTVDLLDEAVLGSLKEEAVVINTSRGGVVNEKALKKKLIAQRSAGAVLDVWENEPRLDTDLLDLAFLGTPHVAGYSLQGKKNATVAAIAAIGRYLGLTRERLAATLPGPEEPQTITLDSRGKTDEEIIGEAVAAMYDIRADDGALRSSPGDFEKLRETYDYRKEFSQCRLALKEDRGNAVKILRQIGFDIEPF